MGISFGSIGATTAAKTLTVRRHLGKQSGFVVEVSDGWTPTDFLEAADILKLELLSGSRCGEISGLRAEEIDRQKCIWTLPPPSRRNGRQRLTPVIGAAREITERTNVDSTRARCFRAERRGHDLGPCRALSADAPDKAADRYIPIARFTANLRNYACGDGHCVQSRRRDRGPRAGRQGHTRTLVRHYVHSDLLERKACALRAWDERLKSIVSGEERGKVVQPRAG